MLRRLGLSAALLQQQLERAACAGRCGFQTAACLAAEAGSGATPSPSNASGGDSFMSWLKDGARRTRVPLTHPLPGVQPETPFRPSVHPPPTEVTVLDNGVRVVTEASPVSTQAGACRWGSRQGALNGSDSSVISARRRTAEVALNVELHAPELWWCHILS